MFSQLFTAAKGLLATKDSVPDASPFAPCALSADGPKINQSPQTPKMVTTTRRGRIAEVNPESSGSDTVNGKRKDRLATSDDTDGQSTKRRKRGSMGLSEKADSPEVPETQDMNDDVQNAALDGVESTSEGTVGTSKSQEQPAEKPAPPPKKNHIRFGSEEPADAGNGVEEEVAETQQEDEQEESDDDEAPESFDNTAQLLTLKAQAQKQEGAKKRFVLI
jgi:U3 small nucleolar RNA-associated protein 16